jgi:LysM repeat protein
MSEEKASIILDKEEEQTSQEEQPLQYIRFNSGDTLESIAKKYGTTPEKIVELNNLNPHPSALQVGHWLYIAEQR